ncbi:hypothetical protein K501DRAFT_334066, partial [Backusella circina FSU 941]
MNQDHSLTQHDLMPIEQPPFNITREETIKLLLKGTMSEILVLRNHWQELPDLHDCGPIKKTEIPRSEESFKEMMSTDWPNGLCLFQFIQLFNINTVKAAGRHHSLTLTGYNHSLLFKSAEEVVEGLKKYYEDVGKAMTVYAEETEAVNVYVCYISEVEEQKIITSYFLFSPGVPFFIMRGKRYGYTLEMMKLVIHSLYEVETSNMVLHHHCNIITAARGFIKDSSAGVLAELEGDDSTPFDINTNLLKPKAPKYVSGKEVSRRVTTLDEEEFMQRQELKNRLEGNPTAPLQQRFTLKISNTIPGSTNDEPISMELVFKGQDVAGGLQKLVEHGTITTPCEWIDFYANSPTAKEIHITKEGVEHVDDEE